MPRPPADDADLEPYRRTVQADAGGDGPIQNFLESIRLRLDTQLSEMEGQVPKVKEGIARAKIHAMAAKELRDTYRVVGTLDALRRGPGAPAGREKTYEEWIKHIEELGREK